MMKSLETKKPSASLMNQLQIIIPLLIELSERFIEVISEVKPLLVKIRSSDVDLQNLTDVLPTSLKHHFSDEGDNCVSELSFRVPIVVNDPENRLEETREAKQDFSLSLL